MGDKLNQLKEVVMEILLKMLISSKSNFSEGEHKVLSEFLWSMEIYPDLIPSARVGVLIDHESYVEEMVIRVDEDFLVLNLEGFERTGMGSDSYERQYVQVDNHNGSTDGNEIDLEKLYEWRDQTRAFMVSNNRRFTVQYTGTFPTPWPEDLS